MIATIRHALRSLRRSPAFTLTVIATLGIGIGLNAAIFTVVDCVLLRPLGFHDADRIVAIRTHFVDHNRSLNSLAGGDYKDVAEQLKGLEAAAYYKSYPQGIQLNGEALYLQVANVGPAFAKVMGVEPVAGRVFQASDADGSSAMVSAGFAREHFGSAQAALGQSITQSGVVHPIVAVLPDGFSSPDEASVWLEQKAIPDNLSRSGYNQRVVAKRRAGVSAAQLSAELASFSHALQAAYVDDRQKTIEAVPLQEQLTGAVRPTLNLLMGSVAVILLIVCVNVTHLQLVRATRQLRSVTIRTALGASRTALAARALSEAFLLAAAGCGAAVLLAVPALHVLVRIAPPDTPRLAEIHLNLDVLLFSFVLSLSLIAVTAVLPVWRSWHIDPASALRQDASRGTEGRGAVRLRNGFLVAEVALTLTLSVAAIVLTRQLIEQSRADLGFSAENLITIDSHIVDPTPPPTASHTAAATPEQTAAYLAAQAKVRLGKLDAAMESLASMPGVVSAGAIDGAPMNNGDGGSNVGYAVAGRQVFAPPYEGLQQADLHVVTPAVFAAIGIPVLRGRNLSSGDRAEAPQVVVINEALARQVFPGMDPIGQQVVCGYDGDPDRWTIVGVVGNIRSDSPALPPTPTFYLPVTQHGWVAGDMNLVVRTRGDAAALVETLRKRLHETHPEIAVKATTMRENIGETERSDTFRSLLFGSFAGVSILLAAVGMYGVTAYSVAQRRFEFGLRVALGANRPQLFGMVLRKALGFAAVGVVLGVGLSLGLMRVLGSVVGRLPAFDAVAYVLASCVVLAIAMLAMFLPARAAAHVDPMTVLRSE
jgi:putative ABC transport system permease protein